MRSRDDYSSRQARMDREYLEAGGDAPNHQKQYPQTFRGTIEDMVESDIDRPDENPQPVEVTADERTELLRWVCTILDGPRSTASVRIAALHRVARFDACSIRASAQKAGCSPSALYREEQRVKQSLRGGSAKK